MKNKILLTMIVLSFVLIPSVFAIGFVNPLKKVDIKTCSGEGELYLYTQQSVEPDVSFKTFRNELLILTRDEYMTGDLEVNGAKPDVAFYNPKLSVKIYNMDTTPGETLNVDATTNSKLSRGIQAYLAQDKDNRVYDPSDVHIVYDEAETDSVYLTPGTYQFIFYDKYGEYDNGGDDSRKLKVTITAPSGTKSSTTYTKPWPSGTEGVVVHSFTATETGYHKISVDTEDSIYWLLMSCGGDDNEVPEFGFIGALTAVAVIGGFVIYRRRK